jgi:hypothetical protein
MKKSLLLAALLLPCAAQAETWVCSEISTEGYNINTLLTFVRQDTDFSLTITTPEGGGFKSMTIEGDSYEILVETQAMLTLANTEPNGKRVASFMINKMTNQFVSTVASFDEELPRSAGSCVRI